MKKLHGNISYEELILERADAICHSRISNNKNDAYAMYVAGRVALFRGFHDPAAAYLMRAILSASSATAEWYVTLGDALVTRNTNAAIGAYLSAIRLSPDCFWTLVRMARALRRAGAPKTALGIYQEALRLQPSATQVRLEVTDILQRLDRVSEERSHLERAVEYAPDNPAVHRRRGIAQLRNGERSAALLSFTRARQLSSSFPERCPDNDALSLSVERWTDEAIEVCREALTTDPTDCVSLGLLLDIYEACGRRDDAIEVRLALAAAFEARAQYPYAEANYTWIVTRKPNSLAALLGMARVRMSVGQPENAIPYLRRALSIAPRHEFARAGLGNALHLAGQAGEGWRAFAPFYYPAGRTARPFEQPVWDGSPLNGKTILLWSRYGRGDVIQFLRYVRFASDAGGRVLVECHHRELLPLIERMPYVQRVIVFGAPLPAFDVHAPLMCFPSVVQTCQSVCFDAAPYLSVDPKLVAAWHDRLKPTPSETTVGICWGGAAQHHDAETRFLPLSAFAPLAKIAGVRIVNLQFGPQSAELLTPCLGPQIQSLFSDSFPVCDAAALIVNLDLVITVDSMIAHLAGALGKPVWTLLRYESNWRWQAKGRTTEWYPTMRLFRQPRPRDWAGAMRAVEVALNEYAAARQSRVTEPA